MTDKAGIEKMREHLFAALTGLSNKTIDIDTAKAIADISQTIINSAKVENEFHKLAGRPGKSEFFPAIENHVPISNYVPQKHPALLDSANGDEVKTSHGTVTVNGNSRVHTMR